jgi:hypothetical protein
MALIISILLYYFCTIVLFRYIAKDTKGSIARSNPHPSMQLLHLHSSTFKHFRIFTNALLH